ncbi:hypothetical protein [Pseudoalteromonas sp. NZS100]|uniref:hypothetical protein n=1 Tax=Pseudoalteromonas sp. NZS100 TaxID=2792046 RepID=UPI0018CF54D6|nr:hypothetical protein [Pseudoalteromonas sp. NZS100]MBH0068182.1 hypothetical protein [Pseudoalteromonas sp. NZS100]
MLHSDYQWPITFPENVPDDSAIPACGEAYRLVSAIPPTSDDFKIYKEDNPSFKPSKDDKKYSFGVSFWSTLDMAREIKRRYPKPNQFGNKKIALVSFKKEIGMIAIDKPTDFHVSLWKQSGYCPSSCFVKEEL